MNKRFVMAAVSILLISISYIAFSQRKNSKSADDRYMWFDSDHALVISTDDKGGKARIGLSDETMEDHLIPFTDTTMSLVSHSVSPLGKEAKAPSADWLYDNARNFFPLFSNQVVWRYEIRVGSTVPVVVFNEQWIITYTLPPERRNLVGKAGGNMLRRLRLASGASPKPESVYHLEFSTQETEDLSGFGTQVKVKVIRDDLDYFGTRQREDRTNDIVWFSMGGPDVVLQLQFLDQAMAPRDFPRRRARDGQIPMSLFHARTNEEFDQWKISETQDQLEYRYRPRYDPSADPYNDGSRKAVSKVEEHVTCIKGLGRVALSQYVDGKLSMSWKLISAEPFVTP